MRARTSAAARRSSRTPTDYAVRKTLSVMSNPPEEPPPIPAAPPRHCRDTRRTQQKDPAVTAQDTRAIEDMISEGGPVDQIDSD